MESRMTILPGFICRMVGDSRTQSADGETENRTQMRGSDGFSGITANPLLGCFSRLPRGTKGAPRCLQRCSEMFGAETLFDGALQGCGGFSGRPSRSSMVSRTISSARATGLREPLAGKQGRGDFHLGRKVIGMYAEIRDDCRVRRVGIWRNLVFRD